MQLTRTTVALLLAVLVALQTGCNNDPEPRGEKIDLKLNLAKGAAYKLFYDMDMDMAVKAQGQAMDMKMQMGFGMAMNVDDVSDKGIHTITTKYDRVKMSMNGMGQNMSYDSQTDKAPPAQFKPLKDLLAIAMTLEMNPKGKVLKISGLEGSAALGEQKAQFEQMMEQAFGMYPEEPIDIRDSWTQQMNVATQPNMPMSVNITYTLYDRQNGKAIVRIDGDIKTGGQVTMEGTMKGEFVVDEATGWTEKGNMTMDISGDMPGGSMTMDAKITITGQ